ncbi:MAG: hypothetical protein M1834_009022 [Cirrosporium novae-zelandiae]|nr:MAG: hypothetical protein M1834_009022 [Cirrosporium novae-zelandiae]
MEHKAGKDACAKAMELYLVTDNTPAILGQRQLVNVVTKALKGGVTCVQLRDKTSETIDMISMAKKLHAVTKQFNVPLLINDRVDVALAAGADGVHIGQDDIDLKTARKLLGDKAIIGVTVCSNAEAQKAVEGGANYVGIGTMFATPTKENTKSVIGTAGTRDILTFLGEVGPKLATVAIGGINASNIQRVIYQSKSPSQGLDGVAVVSAIVGAKDAEAASAELKKLLETPPAFIHWDSSTATTKDLQQLLNAIPSIVKRVVDTTPLTHNMTNTVVQNFSANVALAIGASPIMSTAPNEAADLAALNGGLLINMGTLTTTTRAAYTTALKAYNTAGNPVVFDPVGAGATTLRRTTVKHLMSSGYFTVIKGNSNEILTVADPTEHQAQQRGVDSTPHDPTTNLNKTATVIKSLAQKERTTILMTGAIDILSNGTLTLAIKNGHEYLGLITGSGCALGTVIAAFLAVCPEDPLLATLAAVLLFEIAAENAVGRADVMGPGTFVPAFLDCLYGLTRKGVRGEDAKVEVLDM